MRFADLALVRRLETAEAESGAACARTLAKRRPESGATVEAVAGGFAIFAGVNSPVTQAVALGLNGPVGEAEVEHLEEFYRSRGDAVRVELCPLADMSLVELFGQRGYRVSEFSNVLVCPLERGESRPAAAPGVQVEQVSENDATLWTRIVAQGFAEHFPVTPEILEVMELFFYNPQASCFLARINGEPVGGGALSIHDGIAGMFGASTLPTFRNRGVQTALLQARLTRAAAAGCDVALTITQPSSTSQRNVERQGFRVVYTRAKFARKWI
jgi:ribosomal protein S18 acetylase RimI-like enzyme